VVCRGLSEIDLLERFQPRSDCRYIVASDDLRVHLEVAKYPWVAAVYYLEQMESFYAVAADVINYLELINQWLESLGNGPRGIPKELLFWIRHCEGGKTTQRIQDLLLLIRSYCYLLERYDISSIVILRHPQAEWEDEVLIKVGQSKSVEVRIIGGFRLSIIKARFLSCLKLAAREPYYIFPILRAKLLGLSRPQKPGLSENEIIIQICSSEEKFMEDSVPIMKALKARGYDPVALLWRASAAAGKFQQEGLTIDELETFVPMSSIWEAIYRVWVTWRQARRRRHEFLAHPGLQYRKVALGPLLWPSMQSFFWEELAQRFRLQLAAKKYFADHAPRAIRLWGGGLLAEGSIVSKGLTDRQKPLSIYWFWNWHESPYIDYSAIDFFLAAGDRQKRHLENHGVPSHHIDVVGVSRYDHLSQFRKDYSPSQSRSYLNIPSKFQYYILFDSNYTLRGYLTIREQSLVTKTLLSFAQKHPSVALIIKPHPAHLPGWLEDFIDNFSLPNVFLIDKNMVPYHALNAVDCLITKFSSIALEGMLFEKPVVAVLLDAEDHFKLYDDAVVSVTSIEALNEILTEMVSDEGRKIDRQKSCIKKQASFLKDYFDNNISESARRGVDTLDKLLRDKNN
jgi:hypothetical protein